MESLDYWRLCDELSIIQAALLLAEADPSDEKGYAENWWMGQHRIFARNFPIIEN
jgi:hypothetical protein